MAAKKEADEGSGSTAAEQVCWRKQVDDNLKRLHSLHFGAETALKKRDFSSAQILGLRLLGFLDSHSHSELDHAFVRPIRCEAISNINSARRSLISDSDRKAFELAKKAPTCVFGSRGDIDTEKIKQSKYIRALIQHSNGITLNELGDQSVKQDKPSSKALNSNNQAKRIALRSNFSRENNNISPKYTTSGSCNYDECRIVEKPMSFHNQTKSQCSLFIQKDEEERTSGNSLGAKRMHVDIRSPSLKSPLSSEENNEVSANGFVTARAKLEMDARQKRGLSGSPNATVSPQSDNNGPRGYGGRSYGFSRRGIRGNFVPPIKSNGGNSGNLTSRIGGKGDDTADDSTKRCLELLCGPDGELPEKLRNLEPRLIEHVSNEIMDKDPNVRWEDIAGLDHAKKCVTEMVIWPLLRPDIFKGCRGLHRFPSIQSKQSDYQEFQDYAKPARLFQAAEAKICKDSSAVENDFSSFKNGVCQSLYKVKLGTSNFSASSLTDLNAGVLLCLIDENGDSLLQRIPASLVKHQSADSDNDLLFPFQRGSVDEFTFIGPKLQRVKAIWIGLESGQWRLGRVSLVIVSSSQPSSNQKGAEDLRYVSVKYEFQAEDILLGEGSNISMLELRPCLATEISGLDPSTLSLPESTSLESQKISNEESMRQYADLKFSLLLYDAMLIFFGTSAASFSVGEHGAFAFLAGGIGGFLYLLVLQRSVDELPAPPPDPSSQNTGETEQMIGGFKGPISTVALAIGFALFVAKYSSGDFPMAFTPKDLIVGMLGFLVCKVAVVLAAFKPLENGLKINK